MVDVEASIGDSAGKMNNFPRVAPPRWPVICLKILCEMTQKAKSVELSQCRNVEISI